MNSTAINPASTSCGPAPERLTAAGPAREAKHELPRVVELRRRRVAFPFYAVSEREPWPGESPHARLARLLAEAQEDEFPVEPEESLSEQATPKADTSSTTSAPAKKAGPGTSPPASPPVQAIKPRLAEMPALLALAPVSPVAGETASSAAKPRLELRRDSRPPMPPAPNAEFARALQSSGEILKLSSATSAPPLVPLPRIVGDEIDARGTHLPHRDKLVMNVAKAAEPPPAPPRAARRDARQSVLRAMARPLVVAAILVAAIPFSRALLEKGWSGVESVIASVVESNRAPAAPELVLPAAPVAEAPAGEPVDPMAEFRRVVADFRIQGVLGAGEKGARARALINGRPVQAGDLVDARRWVRFEGVDQARKQVWFVDETGARLAVNF